MEHDRHVKNPIVKLVSEKKKIADEKLKSKYGMFADSYKYVKKQNDNFENQYPSFSSIPLGSSF